MQLYIVYCSNDNYKPPTFHATKEQAMKSYMYLTRLIGDRHAVKVGTLQVTDLPEDEVFDYAQTHYIERAHRSNSVDEELFLNTIDNNNIIDEPNELYINCIFGCNNSN